jgi:flagellar biogenesis protein FliO
MKYLSIFALAVPAFAQNATAQILDPAAPSMAATAVRIVGAMMIVLSVIMMGAWAFKNKERFAVKGLGGKVSVRKLQVLETRSLGARHSICVVGYENQRILLSSSPTGVTMLTHLPEATAEEVQVAQTIPARPSFSDAFVQALSSARK